MWQSAISIVGSVWFCVIDVLYCQVEIVSTLKTVAAAALKKIMGDVHEQTNQSACFLEHQDTGFKTNQSDPVRVLP